MSFAHRFRSKQECRFHVILATARNVQPEGYDEEEGNPPRTTIGAQAITLRFHRTLGIAGKAHKAW